MGDKVNSKKFKLNLGERRLRKMKSNKRGISAVVATVLIILITVAAVTIIWAAIIPMVSDRLEKGNACLDAVSQLSIGAAGYTCYDSGGQNLRVQVKQGPTNASIQDIQVIWVSPSGTTSTANTGGVPSLNGAAVYTVGSVITSVPDSVSIAPILRIGAATETCDIASTLSNIPPCS